MIRLLTALLAFLLFGACGSNDSGSRDDIVAGGDDFPNGLEPMGRTAAREMNDSTEWNEFKRMPTAAPGMYDTVPVSDSGTQKADGGMQTFRFIDGDGDGILSPLSEGHNLTRGVLSTSYPDNTAENRELLLSAGADLDFNTQGDNRLLSHRVVRLKGADTLDVWILGDADGDGAIMDFSRDTNIVDLVRDSRSSQNMQAIRIYQRTRIMAFTSDSTRNFPIRFSETRTFADGGVLEIRAFKINGAEVDSTFLPGDTAEVERVSTPAPQDTLAVREQSFRAALAPIGELAGNRLLEIRAGSRMRLGDLRETTFRFSPESPLADSLDLAPGALEVELVFRDGYSAGLTGDVTETHIRGTFHDSRGITRETRYDRAGRMDPP